MSSPIRQDDAPSFPGSIRAAISHPAGGLIVMSGFPGLETGMDGSAIFLPEGCRETLLGLQELGVETLTLLVEMDELDGSFLPALAAIADEVGLVLKHFPIVDYSVPTDARTTEWSAEAQARADHLANRGTIAFACQYGAGRSGLMAARCLIDGGLSANAAIALVRSHFSEAIESEEQENWLRQAG